MEETKWKLVQRKGRTGWHCRYMLAGSDRWREAATGKTRKREAESAARRIVADAEAKGDHAMFGWEPFCERYEAEHLSGTAPKTFRSWRTAKASFVAKCQPKRVSDVSADMLSRFAVLLRQDGRSESTIKTYRTHVMAALHWARQVGLLREVPRPPALPRVPRGTKSRGRALTREEAERIAMALPGVVGEQHAVKWAWNLEALWRSGMRIGETLSLCWEPAAGMHWVDDLSGNRPRLVIAAEAEKGFRDRILPMPPDFVALLRSVPATRRKGLVFRWPTKSGDSQSEFTIGRRIAKAGQAANVVVNHTRTGVPKYASAHDFRRSFGQRWAQRVMPIVLKELMRHESIETTMSYYVSANADATAQALWSAMDDDLGDLLTATLEGGEAVHELGDILGDTNSPQITN